jgi:hypothetical protein
LGGGEIFLDVPSINRDAIVLAQDLGLKLSVTRSQLPPPQGALWK